MNLCLKLTDRGFGIVGRVVIEPFRSHVKNEHCLINGALQVTLIDFSSLRELMLLEDFKKCLPERIVLYLNEQKVTEM